MLLTANLSQSADRYKVGAYFMDDEDACDLHYLHEGFSGYAAPKSVSASGGMLQISRAWYDAAFQELDRADYLSKPNPCTVQTLAICMLLHRNFGQPDRDYVLLGVAISVARALGMDRLGSEETCPKQLKARPEWGERSGRELGRRLWWTLVICDW
jgi:Fungal specific transcription factor domain